MLSWGFLTLGIIYLWTLTSGVIRFGLFLELACGILIVDCVLRLFKTQSDLGSARRRVLTVLSGRYATPGIHAEARSRWKAISYSLSAKALLVGSLVALVTLTCVAQSIYAYYLTVTNKTDWAQRPSPFYDWRTYAANAKWIGRDYAPIWYAQSTDLRTVVDEIDVWIVGPSEIMAGYSKVLKSNIPIVNINYANATPATLDMFLRLESELDLPSKNVYMLSERPLETVRMELDEYGFDVVSAREFQPTFTYFPLNLIEVAVE
jgi:hypothetical protein